MFGSVNLNQFEEDLTIALLPSETMPLPENDKRKTLMDRTLHELYLKFVIRNKKTKEVKAAFDSHIYAVTVMALIYSDGEFEIKESY